MTAAAAPGLLPQRARLAALPAVALEAADELEGARLGADIHAGIGRDVVPMCAPALAQGGHQVFAALAVGRCPAR